MILVKSILKSPKVIIFMLLNKSESLKSGDLYYKTHHIASHCIVAFKLFEHTFFSGDRIRYPIIYLSKNDRDHQVRCYLLSKK